MGDPVGLPLKDHFWGSIFVTVPTGCHVTRSGSAKSLSTFGRKFLD